MMSREQSNSSEPSHSNSNHYDDSLFFRRTAGVVGILMLAITLGAVFILISDVFFLFFAAILLAILLRSSAEAIARGIGIRPSASLGIVVVLISALVIVAVVVLGAMATHQVEQFIASLPSSFQAAKEQLRGYSWGDEVLQVLPSGQEIVANGQSGSMAGRFTSFFSTTFGVLGNLFVLSFTAIYLAWSPRLYTDGMILLVPSRHRARTRQVLHVISTKLKWWLLGRFVAMVAVGIITAIGLWFVGVQQFLILALIAAISVAVPYIGPIIASIPGLLIALAQGGLALAGWALVVYLLAQTVENYLVTPLVQERVVNMPPVLTIAFLTIFGSLFGILGLIVATPIGVVIMTLVKMIYIEDILDKDMGFRDAPMMSA
jgi:predicted PurR-regulated permease PerM